jgi:hypothetical protein
MHRVVSLMRDEGRRCPTIYWPLALAEDTDGRLVAAVGTHLTHGLVVAGMVAAARLGRRAPVIVYRVGEVYDRAMARSGVRAYYVYVGPALSQWQYFLARLGYERIPVEGEPGQWHRREAGTPWGQQVDSSHAEPVDGFRQRLLARPVDHL